jgi:hypothetical protein
MGKVKQLQMDIQYIMNVLSANGEEKAMQAFENVRNAMVQKTYTIAEINKIVQEQGWVLTICNHEPDYNHDTIQVQPDEDCDYFGEFVGKPDEDMYIFKFYTP